MDDGSVRDLFRRAADHAARFREKISDLPQRPQVSYLASLEAFREPVPEQGASGPDVINALVAKAEPGLHAMTGPRFFGWVIGGSHPVGVAADWMTSAWGQNAGNHHATPAAAAAEAVAADWLLDLLDLPRASSVGFVTGATLANFVCLAAARGEVLRRVGWDVEAQGLFGAPPVTVLIGDDAHTTVFSALQFLGFGHDCVIRLKTDDMGRISASYFAEEAARVSGPSIVILQAGQINTGAFDDFAAIIPIARRIGAWVHVDGAFGLWARACAKKRGLAGEVDQADSWATDGHKWLQTPYDCGYAIIRDEEAHRRAMTIAASYLPPSHEGERDPSHFVPELSRRARGFATWAMIKHLGRQGIAVMVARHCRIARTMAERLSGEDGIAVLNEVVLNQFMVRFGAGRPDGEADRLTQRTVERLQADGVCFVGGANWRGRKVMRVSVISWLTDDSAGETAADAIIAAWRAVRETGDATGPETARPRDRSGANGAFTHRLATRDDLSALSTLIEAAISELQKPFLNAAQIESSRTCMGLDTQLIDDGTYFVVEQEGVVAGCGGWSRRATLYGGDCSPGRDAALLDRAVDPARVRAMYTHPHFTRRGVGRLILSLCEAAARAEGFTRVELMATMAGEPLYRACGYQPLERLSDDRGGAAVPLLRMAKPLHPAS